MTEQQEPTITIDGISYNIADLSDNAKAQLQSLQAAEAEIKRLNIQIALMQTARNAYLQALQADLPKSITPAS